MKRWLDDPDTEADLRLDLLRSASAGRRYDVDAKLPQLQAALEQAETDLPELDGGANAAAKAASSAGAGKLIIGLVVVGCGAGLLALSVMLRPAAHEDPAAPGQTVDDRSSESIQAQATEEQSRPSTGLDDLPVFAPGPSRSADPAVRLEIEQMVEIRGLLVSDPKAAYEQAEASQRRFPRGVFVEERTAFMVLALDRMGAHDAARERARAFLARYNRSTMRATIEAILAR